MKEEEEKDFKVTFSQVPAVDRKQATQNRKWKSGNIHR